MNHHHIPLSLMSLYCKIVLYINSEEENVIHVQSHSHLCHKVCGCVAECFQHGRGLGVEQGHPVGHLVVDLALNVQLQMTAEHKSRQL